MEVFIRIKHFSVYLLNFMHNSTHTLVDLPSIDLPFKLICGDMGDCVVATPSWPTFDIVLGIPPPGVCAWEFGTIVIMLPATGGPIGKIEGTVGFGETTDDFIVDVVESRVDRDVSGMLVAQNVIEGLSKMYFVSLLSIPSRWWHSLPLLKSKVSP